MRILDLSWGIAGPLGVMLLAEQGADVIKVEPPGGDPFRAYCGYAVWNRSRRSVTVDLKRPEGLEALQRLVDDADVLVETFRPGVTDRLGIGFDALHARNPRLVYCSCPGYPEGHRLARPAGLRRARPGEQRAAVGAAGLADGPDLPAHADAEHGRDVPHPDAASSPRSSRARRPAAAST